MTQVPPPPTYATGPYGYVPPRRTNAWAIVSLITGIIGCAMVTAVVAVVTGVVGVAKSRRLGEGRGMSYAGIVLGLAWLGLGVAAAAGLGWAYNKYKVLETQAKPQTIALINHVQQGNVTPDAATGQLTATQLQAAADAARGLGVCQSIATTGLAYQSSGTAATATLDGTATFEHGTTPVHAKMHIGQNGTKLTWQFEDLELK